MPKQAKGLSYWSVRRRIRANLRSHLNGIEQEVDLVENEARVESQTRSNYHIENVPTNDQSLSETESLPNSESGSVDQELEMQFDHDNIEIYFHFHQHISCDSDSDTEADRYSLDYLPESLREWAVKHQISNMSLTELVSTLRSLCPTLPKSTRTLLRTVRQYNILELCNGQYFQFGIETGLKAKINDYKHLFEDNFYFGLQINKDGLPLLKNTNINFGPY